MAGARDRIFTEAKASGGMFLVVPSVVMLDGDLPLSAKMLYGVITWKCGERAYTWATNRELGDALQLSHKRVSALLTELEKQGHIETEIEYKEGSKEIVRRYIYPIVKSSRNLLNRQGDVSPHKEGYPPPENEEDNCNNKIKNKEIITPTPLEQGDVPGCDSEPNSEQPAEVKRELTQEIWFEAFWKVYPRKDKKQDAWKAWKKLKPDLELCRKMSAALKAAKVSFNWTKEGGQYIPLASSWLNGRQWENEGIDHTQIQVQGTQGDSPGGWVPDPEVTK